MIAICPNPYRDTDLKLTRETERLLRDSGFETVICPIFAESGDAVLPDDIETRSLSAMAGELSLAVVIGGDGTILSAARELPGVEVPLLGVNLGTMGFMASLEPDQLPLIVKAARGEYRESARMLLEVSLRRGEEVLYRGSALNDAVIHGCGDTIHLNASCDGTAITTFRGDGIIVSTPTGSTGYSMSAGGPIVEPEADNIIISPICAHTISSKCFVLSKNRTVSVTAERLHNRGAYLSVDGVTVADVCKGDVLTAFRAEHRLIIADMGVKSFYETAFEKLIN